MPYRLSGTRHQSKAFTLVELLVVIGIIALLISILLPSLAKARSAAISVSCLANLNQFGAAAMMYANDNKGALPLATAASPKWPNNGPWDWVNKFYDGMTSLLPYMGGGRVTGAPNDFTNLDPAKLQQVRQFTCPGSDWLTASVAYASDGLPEVVWSQYRSNPWRGFGWGNDGGNQYGLTYDVVNLIADHPWNLGVRNHVKTGSVQRSADKVRYFCGTNISWVDPAGNNSTVYQEIVSKPPAPMSADWAYSTSGGAAGNVYTGGATGDVLNPDKYTIPWHGPTGGFHHNKRCNVAFMDGHAESLSFNELYFDKVKVAAGGATKTDHLVQQENLRWNLSAK